jgi:amino acid transporter
MKRAVSPRLAREIRRRDLVGVGINATIGAGIFGLPARIRDLAGPAAFLAYVVCALACSLIALCLAEVGSRFRQSGGPYLYAREAFGPIVGFEIGWLRWLVWILTFAANANLLVDYTAYVWPLLNGGIARMAVITMLSAVLTAINVIGVRQTTIASNLFAAGKLVPLLVLVGVGIFFVDVRSFSFTSAPRVGSFSSAVVLVMYAFAGFEAPTVPAGEIRDPQRTVPFGVFMTLGVVAALYILVQAFYSGTMASATSSATPLAAAAVHILGGAGGTLISVTAIVSVAGNLNGKLFLAPRVLFAMAEHRQLPPMIAAVHSRFRTPYVAILLSAACALAVALSGTFIQLATIAVLVSVVVYASSCVALPVLRRLPGTPPATFKSPHGSAVTVAAIGVCVWLLVNNTSADLVTLAVAASVGLVVYGIFAMYRGLIVGRDRSVTAGR